MSYDLRLQRTCDHSLHDQEMTISGTSPSYFSTLPYPSDGAENFVYPRELSRTEGLSEFIFDRDGFTNWALSGDFRQINWNSSGLGGPGTGVASFLDGATFCLPKPIMLVSYRTLAPTCPLCQNNERQLVKDVNFDAYGQLETISGHDKIKHLVLKALLTTVGSNDVVTDYGSLLSKLIGEKFDAYAEFRIHNSVERAVQFLMEEQLNQPALALDETIVRVSKISVTRDSVDPRVILIQIDVQTADFEKVPVTFSIVNS